MTAYAFGSGTLIGVRTDLANQTPAVFGVVQDVQSTSVSPSRNWSASTRRPSPSAAER